MARGNRLRRSNRKSRAPSGRFDVLWSPLVVSTAAIVAFAAAAFSKVTATRS
jgi:hypothetical protein